jgi:MOSC domain-containing protein YiiM
MDGENDQSRGAMAGMNYGKVKSQIVEILTAPSPSDPMVTRASARAVPGKGLDGDRYFNGTGTFSPHPPRPDFELTLIQREHIEFFVSASRLPFTSALARRNIVTIGVDLNALVGREFYLGEVRIRGLRLCEPCSYLAKQTFDEVLRGFVHKGGLRAQVLTEGSVHVGDIISPVLAS